MSFMDFCFQNADTKGRNLDQIFWLGMVISGLINISREFIWDVCRHLQKTSLSVPNKVYRVYVKKILTGYSEFCNIV